MRLISKGRIQISSTSATALADAEAVANASAQVITEELCLLWSILLSKGIHTTINVNADSLLGLYKELGKVLLCYRTA